MRKCCAPLREFFRLYKQTTGGVHLNEWLSEGADLVWAPALPLTLGFAT
jgi:hypothetical protein